MSSERTFIRSLALILAVLPAVSCSIKEDRSVCDCMVTADLDGWDEGLPQWSLSSGTLQCWMTSGSGSSDAQGWDVGQVPHCCTFSVAREPAVLETVVFGAKGQSSPALGIRLDEGEECPPLFMGTALLDTRCDEARCACPRLHKCFAAVDIVVRGNSGYVLELSSDVCGLAADGSPLDGPFRCRSAFAGAASMRVPRQKNNYGLRLNMLSSQGALLHSIALGWYLDAIGYDWEKPDLEDISIEVDWIESEMDIQVRKWPDTFEFEVVA